MPGAARVELGRNVERQALSGSLVIPQESIPPLVPDPPIMIDVPGVTSFLEKGLKELDQAERERADYRIAAATMNIQSAFNLVKDTIDQELKEKAEAVLTPARIKAAKRCFEKGVPKTYY